MLKSGNDDGIVIAKHGQWHSVSSISSQYLHSVLPYLFAERDAQMVGTELLVGPLALVSLQFLPNHRIVADFIIGNTNEI